jgi:hypothetical protein
MNVAYYELIYDLTFEALLRSLGLGREQAKTTGISTIVLHQSIEQVFWDGHRFFNLLGVVTNHDHLHKVFYRLERRAFKKQQAAQITEYS